MDKAQVCIALGLTRGTILTTHTFLRRFCAIVSPLHSRPGRSVISPDMNAVILVFLLGHN